MKESRAMMPGRPLLSRQLSQCSTAPRCMNCHSTGDFLDRGMIVIDTQCKSVVDPTGTAQMLSDAAPVIRITISRACTCLRGRPTGICRSPAMPMIWEGLTDHQLCELFKDPQSNGHRTPAQIVEHMHTPLVLWGWNPWRRPHSSPHISA